MFAATSLQLIFSLQAAAISVSAGFESTGTWYAYKGEAVNLTCDFGESYAPLLTKWIHNGTVITLQKNSSIPRRYSSGFDSNSAKAWLEIKDVQYSDSGLYNCTSIHSGKRSSASWTMRVSDPTIKASSTVNSATSPTDKHSVNTWLIIILIVVFVSLFAGMAFLAKWLFGKFRKRGRYDNVFRRTLPSVPDNFPRKESSDAGIYNDITEYNECNELKEIKYAKGDRTLLRENKQTEKIREEAIVFEMQLKSDATRQTWYGTYERKRKGKVPVLISTAPETVDLRLHTQWYRHASSIVKLPPSDYIVSTLGLCIKSENVFLVQEYLPNGTLRDNLGTFEVPGPRESMDEATLHKFVSYTMDITSGLDFLSARGWVHPGLTAAKVLLSFDKTCKLYDFCSLGDATVKLQSIIRKKGKERAMRLPPESFDLTDYTSRSDVWALGVVMWEIFSCGTEPELPKDALSNRESSLGQLLKPEYCPAIVYRAITLCWARDPWSRPSFQDLKEYLNCAIEIHQLAKGNNKSRNDRPSEDLGEIFMNDKEVAPPDISDTCL